MINIQILACVIHELRKNAHSRGDNSTTLIKRSSLHQENDLLNEFVSKIDEDSRRSSRATSKTARFTEDNTISKCIVNYFSQVGQQCFNKTDFLKFSEVMVEAFKQHLQNTSSATGGYIPVLWYQRNGQEFLLIGIVNPTGGFTINAQGDVEANTNIDEEALRFSVSVGLTDFISHYNSYCQSGTVEHNISNYVRWTTKKHNEISHYFQAFVPTDIEIDDTKATRNFINYTHRYLHSVIPDTMPNKERLINNLKQSIYSFMIERGDTGKTINIEDDIVPMFEVFMNSNSLGNVIDFSSYCEEQGCDNYVSIFHPSVKTLNKQVNVSIELQNSIKIKGSLSEIIETTELVVDNSDSNALKYELVLKLTPSEFEEIKSTTPSISTQYKVVDSGSEKNANPTECS